MMRTMAYGDAAILVELNDLDEVLAWDRQVRESAPPGVTDIVVAARSVLIRYDPAQIGTTELRRHLAHLDPVALPGRLVGAEPVAEIPVRYDGADLAEVARQCQLTVREVIERHCASLFTVAFCGFAPGFGYLRGLDPRLRVPRRSVPRTRVPAGAVAIADQWSAIYPVSSPGGWQILGSTTLATWNLDLDPPSLLSPGVSVRFRQVR
ncbi:MAG: 5-oxoprolinase subunit B family protein [Nocardioides sp.]